MEWNWVEKKNRDVTRWCFCTTPTDVFLRSPERKRGFWYSQRRIVKFVEIKYSHFLGAGIPLIIFVCVLGDLADALRIVTGSIQALWGLLWRLVLYSGAIQGWLDHGSMNDWCRDNTVMSVQDSESKALKLFLFMDFPGMGPVCTSHVYRHLWWVVSVIPS